MKLRGDVVQQSDKGDDVEVTVTNVRRAGAAQWRDYGPALTFRMPHSAAAAFQIGRSVKITVEPR